MERKSRARELIEKMDSVMGPTKKGKAIERLRKVLDEIAELKQSSWGSPQFDRWHRNARTAITKTFGIESSHVEDFNSVWLTFVIGDTEHQETYVHSLESAAAVLQSMIDEINEYWEDESGTSRSSDSHNNGQINTKEVFIVHGRDEGAREKVARFLERLDLKPVVLHEQPNKGRTIIEKFEDYARVGFAVVLLTPDDIGKLKGDEGDFEPRARQNVILELGYFIGQLGRERVCALVKKGVEWPSDYDGVLYIPLDDSGGWEMRLIQELKSAGYDIDANRAFAT